MLLHKLSYCFLTHLDWLRPLAVFHLPFSKIEETTFRILSQEFVRGYFEDPNTTFQEALDRIADRYKAVETVNHNFIKRIRQYCEGDADKNALAALDVLVQFFSFKRSDDFSDLKKLFRSS